ncbi:MAG: dihydrolipoyl dehydrogenase [Candidatus Cloacimonetes bacterium]|nr:dihydrolipoyl dehydrogenase [Candidatus Cloacimonadota bacterium]
MIGFEVAIIGGGPGGYTAGIRLQQFGIKAVVFEKARLGGVCLNWGCIPTKALVKIADLYQEVKERENSGIFQSDLKVNYAAAQRHKNEIVEKLVSGIEFLYKKREIALINSEVREIRRDGSAYILKAGEDEYRCKYVILATGSKPKETGNLKFDGKQILSSRDILSLPELPESLAVIGGGVIGCEFASIFQQLGVKVNIIEFLPDLISLEDKEISKRLLAIMKKKKVKIYTKTGVTEIEKLKDKVILHLSDKKQLEAEKVLLSIGREPVCDIKFNGLDLEKERGFVTCDAELRTNNENMFAIGDLTGKLMLAHSASKQAMLVADVIRRELRGEGDGGFSIDYANIPRCTFTNPGIGSVGLTEEQARERYGEIGTGKFMFSANGKALASGTPEGFVKVIFEQESGLIRGMHIIGPEAVELISEGSILINLKADINKLRNLVFAHPTLSEVVGEALEDCEGLAIHKM